MNFFLDSILPWILSLLTFVVMKLAGDKDVRAWYIGMGAQVLWLTFAINTQSYGLLPVCFGLFVLYGRNALKWRAIPVVLKGSDRIIRGSDATISDLTKSL